MTALQASIGALNDLVDAPSDRGRKPGKPIPAGLVTPTAARTVVATGAVVGVGLAAAERPRAGARWPSSSSRSGMATTCLAKGTAWSWLPFALGIPLLPVYGWFGATGGARPVVRSDAARWRRSPGRPWPSRTPGPTSSATGTRGPGPWRPRSAWTARGGCSLALWVVTGLVAVVSLAALGGDGAHSAILAVGVGIAVILAGTVAGAGGWRGPPASARGRYRRSGPPSARVAWILAVA